MADLDKYIDYVIAQVAEGGHSKEEIISDLKDRGLNEQEINEVMRTAWMEGEQIEETGRDNLIFVVCSILLIVIVLFVISYFFDVSTFNKLFFRWTAFALSIICVALFKKRIFKYKK